RRWPTWKYRNPSIGSWIRSAKASSKTVVPTAACALSPLRKRPCSLVLLQGQFRLQAFRNADIRRLLTPRANQSPSQRRAASGRASRYLRLLRAHGLIRKVPRTHTYRLTQRGTQIMATALKLRDTDLTAIAA